MIDQNSIIENIMIEGKYLITKLIPYNSIDKCVIMFEGLEIKYGLKKCIKVYFAEGIASFNNDIENLKKLKDLK